MDLGNKPIISAVYIWENGMVMVFDQYGKQIAEYQGYWEKMKDKIKKNYKGKIEGEDKPLKWRTS